MVLLRGPWIWIYSVNWLIDISSVTKCFVKKLELFQHLMTDYQESLCSNPGVWRDHGFFHGFFHGGTDGEVPSSGFVPHLPPSSFAQDDWISSRCFDFPGNELIEKDQFMLKNSFCDRALSAVNEHIKVEKRKCGKGWPSAGAVVTKANCNLFVDACRGCLKRYTRKCWGTLHGSPTLSLI